MSMLDVSKFTNDPDAESQLSFASFSTELGEDHAFLDTRLHQWIIAFHSIYALLRNGDCPYFYILLDSPVLFLAARVNQVEQIRVVISHSTIQLRQKLQEEQIRFDVIQNDTLIFVGKRHIHALFDYLLQHVTIQSLTRELPLIVAPTAFANGTLQTLAVNHNTYSKHNKKTLVTHHMLELRGYILPHTWYHLLPVMQQSQEGNFTMSFTDTERYTDELNRAQCFDITSTSQAASQMTQFGLTQQAGGYWLNRLTNNDEFSYLNKEENKNMTTSVIHTLTCADNVYTSVKLINNIT
jgi:hypothetical protein